MANSRYNLNKLFYSAKKEFIVVKSSLSPLITYYKNLPSHFQLIHLSENDFDTPLVEVYKSTPTSTSRDYWSCTKNMAPITKKINQVFKKNHNNTLLMIDICHQSHPKEIAAAIKSCWHLKSSKPEKIKFFITETSLKFLNDPGLIALQTNSYEPQMESNDQMDADMEYALILSLQETTRAVKTNVEAYGFKNKSIAMDGNCFFNAVIHQLKIIDPYQYRFLSVPYLRQILIKHVSDYSEMYVNFITEDLSKFCNQMNKDGAWADANIILAFSRLFNVNIVIIPNDDSKLTIIKQRGASNTLHLSYINNCHYESLLRDENSVPTKTIDLENAPFDTFFEFIKNRRQSEEDALKFMHSGSAKAYQHRLFQTIQTQDERKEEKTPLTFSSCRF